MKRKNYNFNPETHTYSINSQNIPGVTTLIGTALPQLKVSDWYLQRGRAVHACAALIAEGKDFTYDPQIEGQVQALKKFFKEVKPTIKHIEIPLFSEKYRFAGTVDLIGGINGKTLLFDYKGSLNIDRCGLQLAGYSICYEEMYGGKINYGFGVEIRDDGNYRMSLMIKLKNYRREFLALRTFYSLKERIK